MNDDEDEDEDMLSATHQSQFTQSLRVMLFVRLTCHFLQPQSGNRYTTHLTRFYCRPSSLLVTSIKESLESLKCKLAPTSVNDRGMERRIR